MRTLMLHSRAGFTASTSDVLELLTFGEVEIPVPQESEVVVQVKYNALNPLDLILARADIFQQGAVLPNPHLGFDVAGVVSAVGDDVSSLKVGDVVAGMVNFPDFGGVTSGRGYADFVATPHDQVAKVPAEQLLPEAAAVSAAGLTALQSMEVFGEPAGKVLDGKVLDGKVVVIQGASGGVGHLATQLATARGATVVAVCSGEHEAFVKSLGAEIVVNYRTQSLDDALEPGSVDFLLFGGHGDIAATVPLIRNGGKLASLLPLDERAIAAIEARGVTYHRIGVKPDQKMLSELFEGLASGSLGVSIDKVFDFDQLLGALDYMESTSVKGKVVIKH